MFCNVPDMPEPLPRTPLNELVADLRETAEDLAGELEGIPAHETSEGEAAQLLEEMADALTRIADGAADPQRIAAETLAMQSPLKPETGHDAIIRGLLNPKRL